MDREQILAFRLARCGLAQRDARRFAEAATPPVSDFARDAALLALSARCRAVTRPAYEAAVDSADEIVVAYIVRGAIHALPAADLPLFGRALIATDDAELGRQLGNQMQRLAKQHGFAQTDALAEATAATRAALSGGKALSKVELHDELRTRLGDELLPWCKGCKSHHAPPMLWRYAVIAAGVRLDAERRYRLGKRVRKGDPEEAVRRFLRAYAPATPAAFAEWAGLAPAHARRLWEAVEDELIEVGAGGQRGWALAVDEEELEAPPGAEGVALIPPGDPYLWKINRPLLAPDDAVRKRLFRPVASPGVVLRDGRLAGAWKAKAKGKGLELTVDELGRIAKRDLTREAERIASLRGAEDVSVSLGS